MDREVFRPDARSHNAYIGNICISAQIEETHIPRRILSYNNTRTWMFTSQLSGLVFLKADRHERPAKGKMRSIVGRCIIPGIYVGFHALS